MTTANEQDAVVPAPDQVPASEAEVVNVETSSDETLAVNPEGTESAPVAIAAPETSVDDDEAPKRNRAQERIEDLVAERNAAKEYAEYWRNKTLEVMNQGKSPATQSPEPIQEPEVSELPPTLEDFGYDQKEHATAYAKWADSRIKAGIREALEATKQQASQEAINTAFNDRVEKFKETHQDFDVVMANPKLPQLDRLAAVMIVNSDHGADISYKLAKNPDLAVRISRMNPAQQALAIGRLEAEVQKVLEAPKPVTTTPKPKPAPVAATKAPAPPEPIPAGGAPSADPAGMDIKEWMAHRRAEARNRRRT